MVDRGVLKGLAMAGGPVGALLVYLLMLQGGVEPAVAGTAAVAVWMGVWWLTEALPLAVTSLLPLVLFPLMGTMAAKAVAKLYMNDVIFLFMGGFMVALAMEKWNLHRRIALRIILFMGGGPRRMLLGFMVATAFLSMWISNTATAMMMVPIAIAVLARYDELLDKAQARNFSVGLLLGVAHAASVGGIATLVGTPPNLAFASIFHVLFPQGPEISFAAWLLFAFPLSALFTLLIWAVLVLLHAHGIKTNVPRKLFRDELNRMGPASREEKVVLVVFSLLALLWITRKNLEFGFATLPGWSNLLPDPSMVGDGTPAVALAILLFILPAGRKGERIMDWQTAKGLPWGIVLLFGGGFALAGGISASGLSQWIGDHLHGLGVLPPVAMTAAISGLMTFTTELTSNTATTQMVLPILGALSEALGRNPFYLMVPATIAASCAFMMPVATPPNAIVFGSGRLRIADMAKTGLVLNAISIIVITLFIHLFTPAFFGGSPHDTPTWAQRTEVPQTRSE